MCVCVCVCVDEAGPPARLGSSHRACGADLSLGRRRHGQMEAANGPREKKNRRTRDGGQGQVKEGRMDVRSIALFCRAAL